MSGSLLINGTLGQFLAKTGPNNLGQSQTNFSWSCFLNIPAAFGTTGGNAQILGWAAPYSTQPLAIQFDFTVASFVALYLQGVGGVLQYNWTPVYGQTIHIVGTHQSVGTSTIYINGVASGTATNLGVTGSAGLGIQVGWNSSKTGSALLANLAIWNGTTLSPADVLLLRNGAAPNSGSLSALATSWWTLGGTAGNNPALNDAGLTDQIGSNNFTSLTNTADAVYSSNSIPYIPPVIIPAGGVIQARSGNMIWLGAGKNPVLGSSASANFTAINTDPTFKLNGTQINVLRYWSSVAHQMPLIQYMPYTPGSPPTAITMLSTDVLTWSVPDNWAIAGGSSLSAQSGTAVNSVGGYEPGLFGYANFGLPAAPTMNVGYNIVATGEGIYALKNVMHRSPLAWTGALTSTVDGIPLTCAPGGTVSMSPVATPGFNGINNTVPCSVGTYTYIADETNPGNPMTATLTSSESPSSITGPTITGGPTNKTWAWTVGLSSGSSWDLGTLLSLKAPTGQTTVSLTNHRFTQGGDAPSTNPGLTMSDAVVAMFTAGPGVYAAISRTISGPDGANSCVFASDLAPANIFSTVQAPPLTVASAWWLTTPNTTVNRQIPVGFVRPYNLAVSPKVFSATAYHNPQTGQGFVADSTYPNYPYAWEPGANSYQGVALGYDWWLPPNSPTRSGGMTSIPIVEYVCTDPNTGLPINHNLQSGQILSFSSAFGTFECFNAGGTFLTSVAGGEIPVYVTSPSTFLLAGATSEPPGTPQELHCAQVVAGTGPNGAVALAAGSYVQMTLDNSLPIELYCEQCAAVPGLGTWLTVSHAMSDAGVTALATRVFNATTRGTPIWVQYSNEILLDNTQAWWHKALMIIENNAYRSQTAMQRTYEVQNIFASVFGADAASIQRVFQPFTNDPAGLTAAMQYAQLNSIPITHIAQALYPTIDASPTYTLAAAQMCADRTDSIAHTGGPGGGQYPILPIAGYHDITRPFWRYNTQFNGPSGLVADGYAALAASGYIITTPKFVCYETSIDTEVWGGVSLSNHLVRAGLNHDCMYHYSYRDNMYEFLNSLQQPGAAGQPGFEVVNIVGLMNNRNGDGAGAFNCSDGFNDGQFAGCWQNGRAWQNQPAGTGTTNHFWSTTPGVNGDLNSHDYNNVSVASQAINDWLSARAGTPPPPTFTVSPTAITQSSSATLTFVGTSTSWSSGSVVTITNSVSGTTTVTTGTFTAASTTSATLAVTAGVGIGLFTVTIDGVTSQPLSVGNLLSSFVVVPTVIHQASSLILALTGTNTSWTSGSVVTITNSVTGNTSVSAGTFTALSTTSATLAITSGPGVGTWLLTIDGVVSGVLTVAGRHKGWFGGLYRRPR